MKKTLLVAWFLGMVGTCVAQQVLAEYDWLKLAQSGQLLGGAPLDLEGKAVLKVANTNDTPLQTKLVRLLNPPVSKKLYAIEGEVKYEKVHGPGYLEMWNYFPAQKPDTREAGYFSRTLGESGDMGKITGTSGWRRFMLPFDRTGTSSGPVRLEINLFLPAQGTVYLSSIKLVEYNGSFLAGRAGESNAWWPDRAGGLIGGIGGSILGCLGSLLAWMASKGKGRGFVVASLRALIALGAIFAAVGCLAVYLHQPFSVWFVPLLLGVILLAILPSRLKQYQRGYEALEMRRMAAVDA